MKNIQKYQSPKYQEDSYKKLESGIYETTDKDGHIIYVVSFSFTQEPSLGEGENAKHISQYPLEDILDTYNCYISDFYEDKNLETSSTCYLEFASSHENNILNLLDLLGKHVYNQQVDNIVKLKIEDKIVEEPVQKVENNKQKKMSRNSGYMMILFLVICMILIVTYLITEESAYAYCFLLSFLIVIVNALISNITNKKTPKKEEKQTESMIRRERSNRIIKSQDIACFEELPLLEESSQVVLKDIDTICKRAIASIIIIQLACDIKEERMDTKEICLDLLKKYGVLDSLNDKEKRVLEGTYTKQDIIDIDWEYETYWSLVWALSLIDDISDASAICDCNLAVQLVLECKNYEEFKEKCFLRSPDKILDLLDLYYRYHWAIVEKQIHPETKTGNLDASIVVERRRGLEWLISEEEDWYNISLDT